MGKKKIEVAEEVVEIPSGVAAVEENFEVDLNDPRTRSDR